MSQYILQRASCHTLYLCFSSRGCANAKAVQQSAKVSCEYSASGQSVVSEADLTEGGPEAEAHGTPSNGMEGAPKHAGGVPHRHQLRCSWHACNYPAPCLADCVKALYMACNHTFKRLA